MTSSLHTTESTDPSQLVAIYQDELMSFVQSRVGSAEDAADLLQDVWVQLSQNQQALKNPRAWLYRVTRNKIIDLYRKKSPVLLEDYLYDEAEGEMGEYVQDLLYESSDSPELAYLQEEFWVALYNALNEMPPKQREVYVKNELEGLPLQQIADQEGEKLKTILSRKRYAMLFLRGRMVDLFEEFVGGVD